MRHHHHTTGRTSDFGGRVIPRQPWARSVLTALLLCCSAFPVLGGRHCTPGPGHADHGGRRAYRAWDHPPRRDPSRRPITANIVEYSFRVRVGPGAYDVIGLHRVVKEFSPSCPYRPPRPSSWCTGISGALMPPSWRASRPQRSRTARPYQSFWPKTTSTSGVSISRWTLVPLATTDFSFMQQWDLGTDVDDLRFALLTARLTGSRPGVGLASSICWAGVAAA